MAKKNSPGLRAVGPEEKAPEPAKPMALLEAVESGNVLEMLKAQRRLVAESLVAAAENTKPQYNNELNKLHKLIAEEEARVSAAAAEEEQKRGHVADEPFDASAV